MSPGETDSQVVALFTAAIPIQTGKWEEMQWRVSYRAIKSVNPLESQNRGSPTWMWWCCWLNGMQHPRDKGSVGWRGTSLVVHWLRVHLPKQETQVPSLAHGDPTCCQATKPVSTTTEAMLSATGEAATVRSPCAAARESPHAATKTQHRQK